MNMVIVVEFFGIPRLRAGVERLTLPMRKSRRLSDVLADLRVRCPEFADACLDGNRLRDGFVASIDGAFFTDQDVPVEPGNAVLIMSADAGG